MCIGPDSKIGYWYTVKIKICILMDVKNLVMFNFLAKFSYCSFLFFLRSIPLKSITIQTLLFPAPLSFHLLQHLTPTPRQPPSIISRHPTITNTNWRATLSLLPLQKITGTDEPRTHRAGTRWPPHTDGSWRPNGTGAMVPFERYHLAPLVGILVVKVHWFGCLIN